jgi:hypothetical protein
MSKTPLKKSFIFFSSPKSENRRIEYVEGGMGGTGGRVKKVGKVYRRMNIVQIQVCMYINGKLIPVETVP